MSEPEFRDFTYERGLRASIARLVGPPQSLTRLAGGSKKGVYRVALADQKSVIAYSWDPSENFWEPAEDENEPFTDASGQALFLQASSALEARGIRTLNVLGQTDHVVLVEDLRGGSLERAMTLEPDKSPTWLTALRTTLERLHADRTGLIGKLGTPIKNPDSCEQIAYTRALRHLAEARVRGAEIGKPVERALETALRRVLPRTEHALIHGELGPDHVLLDEEGPPVLIDIEGLMHFDVEWEHAFMRIRFGADYPHLEAAGLDESRMRFYTLCLRLSLVAGPLRLLDGDFPDRDLMRSIVDANLAALTRAD